MYRLQRDAIGRVIAETDYWGQTTRYRYNLAGHLQARLDPLGQVMQMTTDVMGRVTQKQYPHPNYPDQLFTEHYEYGVLGELVACHNAHSRVERAYDVMGNLIKEQQQGLTVEYGYNVVGQQIQRKSTLGAEIGYQTDGLGRCTGLQLDQQAWIKRQINALGLVEQEQTYAISSGTTPISTPSPTSSNDTQLTSHSSEQHHQLLHHKQLAYNGIGQLIQQHLSSVSAEQQPLNTPTQEQSQRHQSIHRSSFELNYLYGLDGQSVAWQDSQQGLTQVRHDPVGQIITWWDRPYTVIGVIEDMVMESPYARQNEVVYFLDEYGGNMTFLKLNPEIGTSVALETVESVFKEINPEQPFEFQFVNDDYNRKFGSEERVGKLAGFFSILAILICCLGIFGLASFMAERRTKEIGIRKILGASVRKLWELLTKDLDRKSTRLNSSHVRTSRMPSSA